MTEERGGREVRAAAPCLCRGERARERGGRALSYFFTNLSYFFNTTWGPERNASSKRSVTGRWTFFVHLLSYGIFARRGENRVGTGTRPGNCPPRFETPAATERCATCATHGRRRSRQRAVSSLARNAEPHPAERICRVPRDARGWARGRRSGDTAVRRGFCSAPRNDGCGEIVSGDRGAPRRGERTSATRDARRFATRDRRQTRRARAAGLRAEGRLRLRRCRGGWGDVSRRPRGDLADAA